MSFLAGVSIAIGLLVGVLALGVIAQARDQTRLADVQRQGCERANTSRRQQLVVLHFLSDSAVVLAEAAESREIRRFYAHRLDDLALAAARVRAAMADCDGL